MKRIVTFTVIVILLITVPILTGADYIHGYFRYTVEDGSITITDYQGKEAEVTVPAMIGNSPVNVIAAGAFAKNSHVKTVILPDTIMTIEEGAFGSGQKTVFASEIKTAEPEATPEPTQVPESTQTPGGNVSQTQTPDGATATPSPEKTEAPQPTAAPDDATHVPIDHGEDEIPTDVPSTDGTSAPVSDAPATPADAPATPSEATTPPTAGVTDAPESTAETEPAAKNSTKILWPVIIIAAAAVIAAVCVILSIRKKKQG